MRQKIESAYRFLSRTVEEHSPKYVIGLFSGGHDSLVSTHIASQHPAFSFSLHINTGIGIEQTRQFVRDTCEEWDIELREYRASEYEGISGPDHQKYSDIVLEYGFPGPAQHSKMYQRLKERPLRQAIRELDRERTDKTLLVTGVRTQESARRMRHVEPIQLWEGTKIWCAPIHDFSKRDVNAYIEFLGLRRNEVVDLLHSSGECLCGAFAHPGELDELRQWYPGMAAHIDKLADRVRSKGFPWGWDDPVPNWWKQVKEHGQTYMDEVLCIGCVNRDPRHDA